MKVFVHFVANSRNLQLNSFWVLGGFIIFSFLGYFANHKAGSDSNLQGVFTETLSIDDHESRNTRLGNALFLLPEDCDNVTDSGEIAGHQTHCGGFDPGILSSIELPSGGSGELEFIWLSTTDCSLPVNQWTEINGATTAEYDPGYIDETTCFIRCSRRAGCIDYIGESNIITIEIITCGGQVGDWAYDCEDGKAVELIGQGLKNNIPVSVDLPDPASIDEVYVEIVYKGSNPGSTITVYDALGAPYTANREQPGGNSSNVWVYRTVVPSTSSISYQNQSNENNAQSLVAYVFRDVANGTQTIGQFTYLSGYHTTQTMTFDIPIDVEPRDIELNIPVSEMTEDCRILNITASSGSVIETITIDAPSEDGCCLNVVNILLENVEAEANTVTIEVESPTGSGWGCPPTGDQNGQSFVVAAAIMVNVECIDCENVNDGGAIGENEFSSEPFDAENIFNIEIPSGGTSDLEYQWQRSTVSENGPWVDISGANDEDYDPGYEIQTVWYKRLARRDGCSLYAGASNVVIKAISEDCSNGIDDDGDGLIDCFDPDCSNQTIIGGINLGNLTDYLFVFANVYDDANWQSSSKGYIGNVALDGLESDERTSGTIPYKGTIYTNASSLGPWADIVDDNDPAEVDPAQAFAITNETSRINELEVDLANAFLQINALTATPGYNGVSASSLNGLNTKNTISETYIINVTSDFNISSKIYITGDTTDVFILRWDTDADYTNGYQGTVKFSSGGAIVPQGGLLPSSFIHVAGDLNSSGGGSTPASPYPQGPRNNNGLGTLITNGSDFSGGGFFTGYWLTTGDPVSGETSSFSNAIFVGGWYTLTNKFSLTSGSSGVYVAPNVKTVIADITYTSSSSCPNDIFEFTANDADAGVSYIWDFGLDASPVSATSAGPHNISYTTCGTKTIVLSANGNGCTVYDTVYVNVNDNINPTFTVPPDVTINCEDDINDLTITGIITGVSDNCSIQDTSFIDDDSALSGCSSTGLVKRTWTVTDSCGNPSVGSQVITVQDTTDPVLSGVPADVTVECDNIPAVASPTVSDNCDNDVTITYNQMTTAGACTDSYTLTRTWTAEDNCGNTAVGTQNITVEDNTLPVIETPDDVTISCTDTIPSIIIPEAWDNCDNEVVVVLENEIVNQTSNNSCTDNNYTIYRIFKATDACGNIAQSTQEILVQDNSAPEFSGVPNDITVECFEVPAPATPTVTDDCDNEPEIIFNEIATNTNIGACSDYEYEITRTWTVFDNCGNSVAHTQSITVIDSTDPEISGVPADITIGCDSIPAPASPTATDLCDNFIALSFSETSDQTYTGACTDNNYTIIRTWTATDDCGNQFSQSQIITVEDNASPTLQDLPSDFNITTLPVPDPVPPTATDNCDGNITITLDEQAEGGCEYIITRTWTATDNCGNEDIHVQTISVSHYPDAGDLSINDALVCLPPASNGQVAATFAGNGSLPQGFSAIYILTRGANEVIEQLNASPDFFPANAGDHKIYRLVYVADSNDYNYLNLNNIQFGQTELSEITGQLENNGGSICASISGAAQVVVDDCNAKMGDLVFEDLNANGIQDPGEPGIQNVQVFLVGTADDGDGVFMTRLTDDAGNFVFDNLPPGDYKLTFIPPTNYIITATDLGGDDAIDSDADPLNGMTIFENLESGEENLTYDAGLYLASSVGDYAWIDCNKNGIQDAGESPLAYVPVNLFGENGIGQNVDLNTSTDANGFYIFENLKPGKYKLTFGFPTNPVGLGFSPQDQTSDDLDSDVDPSTGMTIDYIIQSGDNNDAVDAGYMDVSPPVLTGVPNDVTVECDNVPDAPVIGIMITATDNLDADVEITFSEISTEGAGDDCSNFNYTITRTWTAYDDCGNSTSISQEIIVEDTSEPIITGVPADITIECSEVPAPFNPQVSDNCDHPIEIQYNESRTDGSCEDDYVLTRTWMATDACGNETILTQQITVQDTTDPELSGVPQDLTVECDQVPTVAQPSATDNCDTNVEVIFEESQTDGNCSDQYILTRTWTAIDNCGNEDIQIQVITVVDTTEPELSGVPADITVECDAIPGAAQPSATDNCDINVEIAYNEVRTDGNCLDSYTLTRSWTATDNCGNQTIQTQIITVEDTTDPELSGVPSDITVECDAVPGAAQPTATDNCDTNVEVEYNEVRTDGNCLDSYTLTRTWTATDNCGNQTIQTQVITIEDTTDPILSGVPADMTVECDAVPGAAQPTATDNCDVNVEVEYNEVQTDGNCLDSYTLTRSWTAMDNCGNQTVQTQIITIEDTTDPVLSGVPADITVECDAIPGAAQPTATDNCDVNVEIAYNEVRTDGNCLDSYTLTRTWTATDNCGNQATQTQIITVEDNTEPVLSGVPADMTVECDAVPSASQPTATDNCDINVEIEYNEVQTDGNCSDSYTLTRTWTATDNCGNQVVQTQIIRVEDTTDPILSGVPADITVECDAIPGAAQPTATDNCDTNVEIEYNEVRTDGNCLDSYTLTRTWTATDNCGNQVVQNQVVTVEDTTDPVLSGIPTDMATACGEIPLPAQPTATDNCDTNVEITFTELETAGPCENSYTLNRTWTAIDNCGNETEGVQVITVEDIQSPILSGIPSDIAVECDAVPAPAQPTATDNCDTNVEITFNEQETPGPCEDSYTLTRTWTAIDNCGNETEGVQIITVEDTTNPILSGVPADLSVACDEVPTPAQPTATDNCDSHVEINFEEIQTSGPCADSYSLIRTWTAIDNCGNAVIGTQTITVEDQSAPIISGIPSDVTVECDNVPGPAQPTATDDCDTNIEISYNEIRTDGNCPESYVLTRTWTAVDNCGNTVEGIQIITVEDNTAPVLSGVPSNESVSCDAIPAPAEPVATDNCDTNVEITFSESELPGNCSGNYIITRTWTAIDNCGNEVSVAQEISVEDTVDPVLSGVPQDISVSCDNVPGPAQPTATDNCDTNVEIIYNENQIDGPCEHSYLLIRTWTAIDDCGNESTATQTISVTDEIAPTLSGVPSDLSVECDEIPEPPALDEIIASDNCDTNVEVEFEETTTGGNCVNSTIITRAWTAIDNCGNSYTATQTITVNDGSAPEITGVPDNISVACDAIPGPANPTATDDCDANVALDFSENILDGPCTDSYIIERIWTAMDNCGNTISATQEITVTDTQAPILSGVPADLTVDCADVPPAPDHTAINATDNCDTEVEILFDEIATPGPCIGTYYITRTWTAIDNCGNETSQTQQITIEDGTPPTISGVDADLTVDCGNIPDPADIVITDDCDPGVFEEFEEILLPGPCADSYTLVRTWTATDHCGNLTSAEQTITVEDITAPELLGVPSNINIDLSNGEVIPDPAVVIGTDNCDTNVEIVFEETEVESGCALIITRTWTAFDNCGNSSSQSQVISVSDELTVSISPSTMFTCEGESVEYFASPNDPSNVYNWTTDGGSFDDSASPNPTFTGLEAGTYTITLTVSTAQGCEGVATATITIFPAPDAEASSNGPICEGETIELFAEGGNAYQWSGPNAFTSNDQNPIIENAEVANSGVYTVMVFSGDCGALATVEVLVNDQLMVDYNAGNADCNNAGFINLGVQGGTGNYTYNWADLPGTDNPEDRDGLSGGSYSVTITDAGGCVFVIDQIIISDDCACDALSGSTIPTASSLCLENGSATISGTPDGNAVIPAGFTIGYLLSNASTGQILEINTIPEFIVFSEGAYTLHAFVYDPLTFDLNAIQIGTTTIFDVYFLLQQGGGDICGSIEVSGAPIVVTSLSVEIVSTTADHCGTCTGTANLSPTNLLYNWSDGGLGPNRQDLCAGSYEVSATDPSTGCSDIITVIIEEDCECTPPAIESLVIVDATCGNGDGSAAITLAGGNAGYSFDWSPSIGNSNADGSARTNLPASIYTVTITNITDPSCFEEITIIIQNEDGPQVTDITTSPATCLEANGSATLLPENFIYTWFFDQTQTNTRSDLQAGTYEVIVVDPEIPSCANIVSVEVGSTNDLSIEIDIFDKPTCGEANGIVFVIVDGGSGNYTVNWSDGGIGDERDDLAAGIYTISVTDNESGCSKELTFVLESEIDENAEIVIVNDPVLLSCSGANDGEVAYTIDYDPGFVQPATVSVINNLGEAVTNGTLAPGFYCVIVTDGNDCIAGEQCFDVLESEPINVVGTVQNMDCNNLGSITLDISGGSGDLTINWADLAGADNVQDRTGLLAGSYDVTITDANGCSSVLNDLIILDACQPCIVSPEVEYVNIGVDDLSVQCFTLEDCFDFNETVFTLNNGTMSGGSDYGIYTLDEEGCLSYNSDLLEGDFIDTVMVIGTYNDIHDTTTYIISISTISLSEPELDTIYFTTGEETPYADCVSLSDLDGNFENSTIWFDPVNGTGQYIVDNNAPCFTYIPDPGQTGTYIDTMGLIVCDDLGVCDSTVIIASVTPQVCPDILTDEYLNLEVFECYELGAYCLPINPSEIFNYQITDNGNPYFNGFVACDLDSVYLYATDAVTNQAPDGPYELVDWTENGTSHFISFFFDLQELVDSMNVWDPAGNWMLNVDNTISGGSGSGTYGALSILQIPFPFNNFNIPPLLNTVPNGTQITVDTGYHEVVLTEIFTGCTDTIILEVDCINIFCPDIYTGPENLFAEDCDSLTEVCLDIPLPNLLDYTIIDNGVFYQGNFMGCNNDSLITYLTVGYNTPSVYTLDNWMINGMSFSIDTFNTIDQLVDSMNIWDPNGNWQVQGILIIGGDFGNNYGDIVISQNGSVIATSNPNIQPSPTGYAIQVDTGFHEIIVMDTITGCIDTFEIFVACEPVTGTNTDTLLTVFEGMVDTFCLDVSGLGTISSIINVCPNESDGNVGLTIIPGIACVEYSGNLLGIDTFCIEVCDTDGICDTTTMIIETLPLTDTIYSTILLGFSDTICIDTSIFQGDVDVFANACFPDDIDFFLNDDQYCVEFMGIDVGMDTLCIITCDEQFVCDTTIIIIDVLPQTIDTLFEEVLIETTDTICIDTTELAGDIVSINNYCEGSSGTYVDFEILDEFCVSFAGLLPEGTDTACIEICDEFGFCDTTILIVTTLENSNIDPPIAVDDDTMTLAGAPVVIDILLNDTLNSTLIDIGVISGPDNGSIVINSGLDITYLPDPGFCDGVDSFTYFITTAAGSDTATVYIEVVCDELIIYNGISPNGDGINDGFYIGGIESYPDNKVYIFNRWGNQVYEKEAYTNDDQFDGTWNSRTLPDGTYFYFIEVKDEDGNVMKFNGYLQIHR